jgi:hypothetical protein
LGRILVGLSQNAPTINDLKEKRMKRSITLLILVLGMALVACGGGESETVEVTPANDVAAVVADATQPSVPATPTLPPAVISESDSGDTSPETNSAADLGPTSLVSTDAFGYGIQVHGNATVGDPAITMDGVRNQLGLDWVKVQIQWWLVKPDLETDQWFFYDSVVEQAHANNLRLMVSVVGAPEWTRAAGGENGPPDDYNLYASFLTEMLNRYPGQIDAIEVWNEQNLDREWTTANGISPEDYVKFLQVAYQAIKAYDPNIIVISGALSPTALGDWVRWADDFEYMDRALAAGMLSFADCVGAHHNGYNIGPDVRAEEAPNTAEAATASFRGPFDDPRHLWSFRTTIETYAAKVKAIDPNKKLCVTEFGWASSEGYAESPTGFGFALDNTLQEQADFIVQAFQQMHDSGDVWLAFLFNFDYGNKGGGPTDDPVPYSIIDTQGGPRPAFEAIAKMEKDR